MRVAEFFKRLVTARPPDAAPPSGWNGGLALWGVVRESFAGAWQSGVTAAPPQQLLAFSAVYACVGLISDDISKLCIKLMREMPGGLSQEVLESETHGNDRASRVVALLERPNRYQTHIQFIAQWLVSKLLNGNAYVLRSFAQDDRSVPNELYVLDPRTTVPLVTPSGDVYYSLKSDYLASIEPDGVVVPASEIAHDRMMTPWHPLVGVPPIFACGISATQGLKIQGNSARFFENMSRPSGQLTAPGSISDDTAARLKAQFEQNFSGGNIGRLLVTGDGLKYEAMSMPPEQAQMIEQLKWTAEDAARPFMVPLYKLGLAQPTVGSAAGALNQDYYSQCLQRHIEDIEALLDQLLGLRELGLETEFDVDSLLRMDPLSRAELNSKAIGAGYKKPNEARAEDNKPPVKGGDSCYMQQQNYSLEALAKRDAQSDPFASGKPAPAAPAPAPATPQPDASRAVELVRDEIGGALQKLRDAVALETERETALLADALVAGFDAA